MVGHGQPIGLVLVGVDEHVVVRARQLNYDHLLDGFAVVAVVAAAAAGRHSDFAGPFVVDYCHHDLVSHLYHSVNGLGGDKNICIRHNDSKTSCSYLDVQLTAFQQNDCRTGMELLHHARLDRSV